MRGGGRGRTGSVGSAGGRGKGGGRAAKGLSEAAEALLGMGFADEDESMVRMTQLNVGEPWIAAVYCEALADIVFLASVHAQR